MAGCSAFSGGQGKNNEMRPNILILLTDDMGYGDIGCYGNPLVKTPNIDKLAAEGLRFTNFLAAPACVPSRCQLMTGRYRPRVKMGKTGADGKGGLPPEETTLAEALKMAGYRTGMAGKWHLGYAEKRFLPPNRGFDSWLGLPYSNDFQKPWVETEEPLGLYRGTEMVEHPIDQDTLTTRYTEEAVQFIRSNPKDQPFFFYLAYNMPHVPIHAAKRFRGQSQAGLYGDVIQAIDWSVGQVLKTLHEKGMDNNTIVFFASDNGPWLNMPKRMLQGGIKPWHAGSPGPLRGGKGTTYEGGFRVPAMIRWTGQIPPGQVTSEMANNTDIYRTALAAAKAPLPKLPLDGYDLLPFLKGKTNYSPRKEQCYFYLKGLEAYREGKWKLRLTEKTPQLFDLEQDPGERHNQAEARPDIVERLKKKMGHIAEEVGERLPG